MQRVRVTKINNILGIIDLILLSVIAMLISLNSRAVPFFMCCLFVNVFLKKESYANILKMFKSFDFYILILPFILSLVGCLYSSNKDAAYRSVETISSLLIFTIIFFLSIKKENNKTIIKCITWAYVIGVLISYMVLWSRALPVYLDTGDSYFILYTKFSEVIKSPNYLSYNVLIAIVICLVELLGGKRYLFSKRNKFSIGVCVFLFLIFSVFLFQLLAKSTIIIYFIVLLFSLLYSYKKKIIRIYFLLLIIITIGALSSYMFTIPEFKQRFTILLNVMLNRENIDYAKKESSTIRYSAINTSFQLIKENWLIGVGTGDVVDELYKSYVENEFSAAESNHTNPHNQYLRMFIMSGIFGLLSVILLFYVLARSTIKNRDVFGFLYFISMALIFLFDDLFIFRDGIVLFGFFTPYFVFCKKKMQKSKNINETIEKQEK